MFKLSQVLRKKMLAIRGIPEQRDVVSVLSEQLMTACPVQRNIRNTRLLSGCHINTNRLTDYVASEWVCHPVRLLELTNAYINVSSGVVFFEDSKKYILETSWGWGKYTTASVGAMKNGNKYFISGSTPTYVVSGRGYHGIVEDLSVILLLISLGREFRVAVSENNKWMLNLLELFLPSNFEISIVPSGSWVICNELLITTKSSFGEFVHPELIRKLNASSRDLCKSIKVDEKKIFISRSDSLNRIFSHEKWLSDIFIKYDFECVRLSDLDVLEQVKLFYNATHVVGMHGAGFTNILWGNRKLRVREFFHQSHFNSCYSSLSYVLDHEYSNCNLGWNQSFSVSNYSIENILEKYLEK